ncbi:MAG: YHS domain-containing protein [Thermoflexibacter sp.]|jgi:YHS domain-containing protein|nr:YHS domain-containing protein [Thermoflexibacter sp.]
MKNFIILVLFVFSYLFVYQVIAQDETNKRKSNFNLADGVAIEGYDPVAYFDGKPLEGKKNLQYSYQGITYRFANQTNMDKFKANPAKYEPAYGGWCAYAMGAKGEKVEINPETYKITNGRLFLFYNAFFNNTLKDWNKDEKGLMKKADDNWKKVY